MAAPEPFPADAPSPVPVLSGGILVAPGRPAAETAAGPTAPEGVTVTLADGSRPALTRVGRTSRWLITPPPEADLTLEVPGAPAPVPIQVGGWAGRVERVQGGLITGWARNLRHPGRDSAVVAFSDQGVVATAAAPAAQGGRFVLVLPPAVTGAGTAQALALGIAGSDCLLDGGQIRLPAGGGLAPPAALLPRARERLAIRIKISTPNLKEAPMWGDFHFANSLAAAFERLGHQANVDTANAWYAQQEQEDVVIAIRGRHRVRTDPAKVNILWIISHPDRIPEEEYADYDHVAVASDIHAGTLAAAGLPSVGVLHQATDARLFGAAPETPEPEERLPACLFVGNSRREYRTMVRWCLQKRIPVELYGGGWEGILPEGMVKGQSIANADLPACYRRHLMLLNDHWDSMRENGFLSNRLFDGSAGATPILTDPVAGLAEVFGDTISEAGDIERFAAIVRDCLADPAPYLERARRARDIVMAAHTFDHRAAELAETIDRVAARKRRFAV